MSASAFGQSFLRQPDLFPGRVAGDPWGAESLDVSIGGVGIRLRGLSPALVEAASQRFGSAGSSGGDVDTSAMPLEVQLFRSAPDEFVELREFPWWYTIDYDYSERRIAMAGRPFMAIVELGSFQADAASDIRTSRRFRVEKAGLWLPSESAAVGDGALENVLRFLMAYELLATGGLLLHSAAFLHDQRAHLFLGHSGAGKSTLSRFALAAGRDVLSDDVNTLVPRADGFVVQQVPFAGDLGHDHLVSGAYPLERLYRLEQAPDHSVTPISPASMSSLVVSNAPFVNADPHRLDDLFETVSSLIGQVPASKLAFRRDSGFVDLL